MANALLTKEDLSRREPTYPLAVSRCPECHLVQLVQTVSPEKLFSHYLYLSSFSDSFLHYTQSLAEHLIGRLKLTPGSRVVEIGSNDGYLLQRFKAHEISVLGVEPAKNIAQLANEAGLPTLNAFFGRDTVDQVLDRAGAADALIGLNVLAHVPDIFGVLEASERCLGPDGTAVFEFPWLLELLRHREFDTIYHEHVYYLSLTALAAIAERARLRVVDVVSTPTHGGSLRVYLRRERYARPSPRVSQFMEAEHQAGLHESRCYEEFAADALLFRTRFIGLLASLSDQREVIAGYGAPAKGNTLLNFCAIGADTIRFTVDRNPHKQGMYLPGSRIPVFEPAAVDRERPDYLVVLPWNLEAEILVQMAHIRTWGGRFIIPVTEPKIA